MELIIALLMVAFVAISAKFIFGAFVVWMKETNPYDEIMLDDEDDEWDPDMKY